MDTALAPLPPGNPPPLTAPQPTQGTPTAPPNFAARLMAMPRRSQLMMAAGLALFAAAVLALTLYTSQGDYRPLFTGLSDKDGGAVIAQLSQMNVPYRNEPGGIILVPSSQVYDLRMKLASQGLPRGSNVGFELLDKAPIGQTQFSERTNYQRALEGELTRTIEAMSDIVEARVHLAMPQQNGFFREQQKPSASVMLTLRGGRTLDRDQIAGIVHLISSSVPDLAPADVSVVDQTGALLSRNSDDKSGGLDSEQLRFKQQIEANYNKRIQELLEPVIGRNNLRSTVTADLDFNQVESTAESYRPNQGQGTTASVRSMQTNESTNGSAAQPTGVPGASSNTPPVPATAPVNGASAPLQATQTGGAGQNSSHHEQTTNYELDKTVRVQRDAVGDVRRLAAAVVVNYHTITDPKGKTTNEPLTQAELDKLDGLVKEALGFNADRGDTVRIVSAPFLPDTNKEADVPLWKQPEVQDMLRTLAVPAALVIVALIAVFGLVRPALRAARPPEEAAEAAGLNEVIDEENELPMPRIETPVNNERLERARSLARDNPVAVANIVRSWVTGEEVA